MTPKLASGATTGTATEPDGRRRRGEQQRQRLLEATLQVIATGGVAAVSQRAVARQAGVSPAAVLYHFATVDDLLAATLHRVNDRYLAELTRAGRSDDPLRVLATLVATADTTTRPLALAEFELVLRATRDPAMRAELHQWWDELARLLEDNISDPQRRRAAVAMVDGLLLRQLVPGAELSAETVEALLRAVAEGS